MLPAQVDLVSLIPILLSHAGASAPIHTFAYIDPIGGSLFVQAIIAGVLGAAVTVKGFGSAVKKTFLRMLRRPKE